MSIVPVSVSAEAATKSRISRSVPPRRIAPFHSPANAGEVGGVAESAGECGVASLSTIAIAATSTWIERPRGFTASNPPAPVTASALVRVRVRAWA